MEKLTEVKMLKNVIMGYERTYLSTDDFLCDSLPKAFVGDLFPSVEATMLHLQLMNHIRLLIQSLLV